MIKTWVYSGEATGSLLFELQLQLLVNVEYTGNYSSKIPWYFEAFFFFFCHFFLLRFVMERQPTAP